MKISRPKVDKKEKKRLLDNIKEKELRVKKEIKLFKEVYNTIRISLEAAVNDYNEAINDARLFQEEFIDELDNYLNEKDNIDETNKWQYTKEHNQIHRWIHDWSQYFDGVEISFMTDDDFNLKFDAYKTFKNMPNEPSDKISS